MSERYDVVILGLALSSSWGNGHATTYRALIKGLARHGRRVLFLERDLPCYAAHRDFQRLSQCRLEFYDSLDALARRHTAAIRDATAVIVGSQVPQGIEIIDWVRSLAQGMRVFYDIDTPITLRAIEAGTCGYLERAQIPGLDLYLSFSGGATLTRLTREFGASRAAAFWCCVDPDQHRPVRAARRTDLGYLGTHSADREPKLERLLLEPARRATHCRFLVVGAGYPDQPWPANVILQPHLSPGEHSRFYSAQRFTLNITREDMAAAGHAPSVRLFEAAACGVPMLSEEWSGIDELFEPGAEILLVRNPEDVEEILIGCDEPRRRAIGVAARARVLASHTGERRASELARLLELGTAGRRIVLPARPLLRPREAPTGPGSV